MIKCSCGSTNCSLIPWNGKKEGAKSGGLCGAIIGGLIGLAGGPIGAIAGAAIGAAGGAVVGENQPTDESGRKIEKYICNSCNKKFDVCPSCKAVLCYKTKTESKPNGHITKRYCKKCNNLISSSFTAKQTAAQSKAQCESFKAYGNLVKKNIDSFYDD